jgi:hypothetical protein
MPRRIEEDQDEEAPHVNLPKDLDDVRSHSKLLNSASLNYRLETICEESPRRTRG